MGWVEPKRQMISHFFPRLATFSLLFLAPTLLAGYQSEPEEEFGQLQQEAEYSVIVQRYRDDPALHRDHPATLAYLESLDRLGCHHTVARALQKFTGEEFGSEGPLVAQWQNLFHRYNNRPFPPPLASSPLATLMQQGRAASGRREFENALLCFQEASQREPLSPLPALEIANLCRARRHTMGLPEERIALLDREQEALLTALRLEDSPDTLFKLAELQFEANGDSDPAGRAIEFLLPIIQRFPEHPLRLKAEGMAGRLSLLRNSTFQPMEHAK